MALTFNQRKRIQLDVVLGVLPPKQESPEAAAFRQSVEKDVKRMTEAGVEVSFVNDWDADDDPAQEVERKPAGDKPSASFERPESNSIEDKVRMALALFKRVKGRAATAEEEQKLRTRAGA